MARQTKTVQGNPTGTHRVIFLVFFLSGAAGLVYEVSWSRQIGLYFGHTVHAAAITLAAFFGGMTIGYLLAAATVRRVKPLVGYAFCEFLVAIWALLLPSFIRMIDHPVIQTQISMGGPYGTFCRGLACLVLLLPATSSLGATLPYMAEYMSPKRSFHPGQVSFAYGLNTAGALLGVLLGTFVLIAAFGVVGSSRVAAGVSAACGLMACLMSRLDRNDQPVDRLAKRQVESLTTGQRRLWYTIAAISGFVTMGLQVAYVRMFALVFHNSTYTFGAVIAVFLAALAVGSLVVAKMHERIATADFVGWFSGIGAVSIGFSSLVFVRSTDLAFFKYGENFTQHILAALGLVALVSFVPIVCLGTILPLCWKQLGGHQVGGAGECVGRLTAFNTLFAAVGSVFASFVMLPRLGLWYTVGGLAALAILPCLLLLRRNRWTQFALVACGLASAAVGVLVAKSSNTVPPGAEMVASWESPYALVDIVGSTSGQRFLILRENIHYQHGDTGPSRQREYRQAHLPLLLHPAPKRVLFLGLGTGLTAGAAVPHSGVEQIAAVELIPEVLQAARYFGDWNYQLQDDPRVELFVNDARHFLRNSQVAYDVIVSDLFVPWQSHTGYLYTREHYQVAKSKLADGGLFCQWVGLYQLGKSEFELIADTFASVFPETELWFGRVSQGMIALIGSSEPLTLSGDQIQGRLAKLPFVRPGSRDFDPYLADVTSLFRLRIGSWSVNDTTLFNTDERPRIEFRMPVTYGNRELLKGAQFLAYFDERLASLPDGTTRVVPASGTELEGPLQRRAMQRSVIVQSLGGGRK